MVEILKEKCIGCGQCVKECFPNCLTLIDGKAHANHTCIECGHCYAVCPTNAICLPEQSEEGVIEFDNSKPTIDSELMLNFIKSRRSIRNYQDKKIQTPVMEHILEAGRFTPTGGNVQDVHYIFIQENLDSFKKMVWDGLDSVIRGTEQDHTIQERYRLILQNICEAYAGGTGEDRLFFNAPALLIVLSNSALNGGLASSNIELMANAEGLGVLYSGFIQMAISVNPAACEYLKIHPEQIKSCMLIGYPNVSFRRTVPRKPTSIQWM